MSYLKYYFLIFIFSIITTSCHECCEGKEYDFRVRIEILTSNNIELELVYTNKNNEKHKVKGNLDGQFIEFCLNEEPLDLQFIFVENTTDKELKINSLLLENINHQMFIEKDMIHLYFKGNRSFKYYQNKNTYKIIYNNNTHIKPTLSSRNSLKIRLKKRLAL